MHRTRRLLFAVAALAAFVSLSAPAQAQNQIVYSYAALLDSADNHYVPINMEMYPPMPKAGYLYFMDVEFRFTNKQTSAPVAVVANANNPGVSFAGYRVINGTNLPTAWLIKLELVPMAGTAPHILAPATLGDKFYIGYDPAVYEFNEISLADPLPTTGGAKLVKRAANFADLPNVTGGSWRADYSRAAVVAASTTTTTTTSTTIAKPALTTTIKPTVPVIKK